MKLVVKGIVVAQTRPVVTAPVAILATAATTNYVAVRANTVVQIQVLIAVPIIRSVVGGIVVMA